MLERPAMTDDAIETYGRLSEGLHITGYSFERACESLEWLLVDDRWALGGRFADVNAFMDSIRLDQFRAVAESRKRIAQRMKELHPAISNRQIARTLGVDHDTVNRDVGGNPPRPSKKANALSASPSAVGGNPPPTLTGPEAAKIVRRREGMFSVRERRAEREIELAAYQAALPDQQYGVIYADPPWRWETWSRETGLDRAAESIYPTMTLDAIKALDVASIAADDCALFLWSTAPTRPQAHEVMAAWGFAYKTDVIWIKDKIGTGYWFRNQHEYLLLGTRGQPPVPAPGTQWSSLIEAAVRGHSRKPEKAYELIEAYFPNLPKVELFARGLPRPGWSCWGNEVQVTREGDSPLAAAAAQA